jgi:hypothetical protein
VAFFPGWGGQDPMGPPVGSAQACTKASLTNPSLSRPTSLATGSAPQTGVLTGCATLDVFAPWRAQGHGSCALVGSLTVAVSANSDPTAD